MNRSFKITKLALTISLLFPSFSKCQLHSFISSLNQPNHWVDSVFKKMTLKEKIAQVFMVRVYSGRDKLYQDSIAHLIKKEKIGGLVFFAGSPLRQVEMTNYFGHISKVPMLIAMDGEWGLGMRLDSVISYPFQMALGAIQNDELIYQMGLKVAADFKRMGMQMNFAPDMDINNNPNNPVINYRSFGDDKYNVAKKGLAYMRGMQDGGVLTTAKHFPGHGDTNVDSHLNLPELDFSPARLDSLEEFPFKQAIGSEISGIMVAHMNIPALDSTKNLPSTLSKPIISGLLKQRLGFKGLIISDAMNMKGVIKYFPNGEADLRAFSAGNDILELSENTKRAEKKIKKAVRKGQIPIEDLNEKVKKILYAKYWAGLNNYKPVSTENLIDDLNPPDAKILVQKLADAAVTSLKANQLLPLTAPGTKTLIINIGTKKSTVFATELAGHFTDCKIVAIDTTSTEEDIRFIFDHLKEYDQVITGIYDTRARPKSTLDFNNRLILTITGLAAQKNSMISVFANPYTLNTMPGIQNSAVLLVCYQMSVAMQHSAAKVFLGQLKTTGKLPVTVNRYFINGTGF